MELGDSDKPEGVELEVRMKDGRVLTEYVRVATGELPNPLSVDTLKDKFMNQVEFSGTVSTKDAEKLLELLDGLEDLDNVNKIIELAVKR